MTIPDRKRALARELYVVEGLSLDQAAETSGVRTDQAARWSREDDWPEMRRRLSQDLLEIERNTIRLRKLLLQKALESLLPDDAAIDSRIINAVARLEQATAGRSKSRQALGGRPGISRGIKTPQEAVQALQESVDLHISRLLTYPESLTLAAIKDAKKALELVDELKARYAAEQRPDQARGLSEEKAAEIRRKIMGLKS